MDRKTKWKAGCGLAAVFGAGALCGAVALFVVLMRIIPLSEGWRDDESKTFVTNHLASRLELTPDQLEKVRPIVHAALDQRYARRQGYVKEDVALTGEALSEILPILTEPQRAKAKEIFMRWKKGKERLAGALD